MPRNKLIAQVNDELVQAKVSLLFWQAQTLLLASTAYVSFAEGHVVFREAEVVRLVAAHDLLEGASHA